MYKYLLFSTFEHQPTGHHSLAKVIQTQPLHRKKMVFFKKERFQDADVPGVHVPGDREADSGGDMGLRECASATASPGVSLGKGHDEATRASMGGRGIYLSAFNRQSFQMAKQSIIKGKQ